MPQFKDMLKYFRQRGGLSQKDLSKIIGVSASTISMYEVGQREPDFEIEERLADFFNTDLDTLRGIDRESTLKYDKAAIALWDLAKDKDLMDALNVYSQMSPDKRKRVIDIIRLLGAEQSGDGVNN